MPALVTSPRAVTVEAVCEWSAAVDGKTLRGSRNAEGKRVHLLSAVDHAAAVTLAHRNVGSKTNETSESRARSPGWTWRARS